MFSNKEIPLRKYQNLIFYPGYVGEMDMEFYFKMRIFQDVVNKRVKRFTFIIDLRAASS